MINLLVNCLTQQIQSRNKTSEFGIIIKQQLNEFKTSDHNHLINFFYRIREIISKNRVFPVKESINLVFPVNQGTIKLTTSKMKQTGIALASLIAVSQSTAALNLAAAQNNGYAAQNNLNNGYAAQNNQNNGYAAQNNNAAQNYGYAAQNNQNNQNNGYAAQNNLNNGYAAQNNLNNGYAAQNNLNNGYADHNNNAAQNYADHNNNAVRQDANSCAVTSDVQAGFKGIDSYGNAICVCPDWYEFVQTYDGNICRKVGPKGNAQYPCAVSTAVTAANQGIDHYGNQICVCPQGYRFVSGLNQNQCLVDQAYNAYQAPAQNAYNAYNAPAQNAYNAYNAPAQNAYNAYNAPAQNAYNAYNAPAQNAYNAYQAPAQNANAYGQTRYA